MIDMNQITEAVILDIAVVAFIVIFFVMFIAIFLYFVAKKAEINNITFWRTLLIALILSIILIPTLFFSYITMTVLPLLLIKYIYGTTWKKAFNAWKYPIIVILVIYSIAFMVVLSAL